MTKNEAIEKIGGDRIRAEELVNALSALGLLVLDNDYKAPYEIVAEAMGVNSRALKHCLDVEGLRLLRR